MGVATFKAKKVPKVNGERTFLNYNFDRGKSYLCCNRLYVPDFIQINVAQWLKHCTFNIEKIGPGNWLCETLMAWIIILNNCPDVFESPLVIVK